MYPRELSGQTGRDYKTRRWGQQKYDGRRNPLRSGLDDADAGRTGRRLRLGDNKEVFEAKVFALHQALKIEARNEEGANYTVVSDSRE